MWRSSGSEPCGNIECGTEIDNPSREHTERFGDLLLKQPRAPEMNVTLFLREERSTIQIPLFRLEMKLFSSLSVSGLHLLNLLTLKFCRERDATYQASAGLGNDFIAGITGITTPRILQQ